MSAGSRSLNWPFAAAWAALTLVGWLAAANLPSLGLAGSVGLLLAGLFTQFVTVSLRNKFLRQPKEPAPQEPLDRELTWWLSWTAEVHMLGMLLMLGSSGLFALFLLLINLVTELAIVSYAPLSWQNRIDESLKNWFGGAVPAPKASSGLSQSSSAGLADEEPHGSDVESDLNTMLLSQLTHRQLPSGEKFMTGWMQYEFEAGQKQAALTIGFFPPFHCVPEVDLDQEVDELLADSVDGELTLTAEHITPAGMRVILKRSQPNDALRGKLLWHASPSPKSIPIQQTLP